MKFSKLITLCLAFIFAMSSASARFDEGMWLPMLLKRNYEDMKKYGLKLTPEQIYDINNASLKDAVVSFGGFCTGEVISDQGLVLTNHHCGYGAIQDHSSDQTNILQDGFWARSLAQELQNENLFVRFLVKMEDVTKAVLADVTDDMDVATRNAKIDEAINNIEKDAKGESQYDVGVRSFYEGNEYFLFVYETFRDVRLVAAPPSAIGKFGGDTDNWMWPRHTGDFSMFRIYAGPDGKPADYSPENVPYKPKHFLPINISGYDAGDYAMVFGFPGRTQRYLTSYGIQEIYEVQNPVRITARRERLDIMKYYMDQKKKTKIQYASKYASISNYYKYSIGQNRGLERLGTIEKKRANEDDFQKWASENPERAAMYGNVLAELNKAYTDRRSSYKASYFIRETLLAPELVTFALSYRSVLSKLSTGGDIKDMKKDLRESAKNHFKDFNADVDKEIFVKLYTMYFENVKKSTERPDFFAKIKAEKTQKMFERYAKKLYKKSIFADRSKVYEFLSNPSAKKLEKDLGFKTAKAVLDLYQKVAQQMATPNQIIDEQSRLYVKGLHEMNSKNVAYPDANSTMRLTYGTVGDYYPMDAVHYDYYTTVDGMMEKYKPGDEEFDLPQNVVDLIKAKDFGRYSENGTLNTCFITNNDITGGNSGSPVINGSGELMGIAFDGNWEAMTGDLVFDPEYKRCINTDIRYILWTIEKVGGATNLIDELKIMPKVDRPKKASTLKEANELLKKMQSEKDSLLALNDSLSKHGGTPSANGPGTIIEVSEAKGRYIVIKSFKDKKRAEKFQKSEEGKRTVHIIYSEKYGWFYCYTYNEHNDPKKAYEMLTKERDAGYSDAWMYIVK